MVTTNGHDSFREVSRHLHEPYKDTSLDLFTAGRPLKGQLLIAYCVSLFPSSWHTLLEHSRFHNLKKTPSSVRRKDLCSMVSDQNEWLWAMCAWLGLPGVVSSQVRITLQQQLLGGLHWEHCMQCDQRILSGAPITTSETGTHPHTALTSALWHCSDFRVRYMTRIRNPQHTTESPRVKSVLTHILCCLQYIPQPYIRTGPM